MNKKIQVLFYLLFVSTLLFSQEQRLQDKNSIGWIMYTGQFKLNSKLSIHSEYQWRRVNGLKNWQQNFVRSAIMYSVRKDISLNAGYAFADTYSYGDFPGAFRFPEHRFFEQVVIKNPIGTTNITHRFTLEQRFLGKVSFQNGNRDTDFSFLNRMRYRFRAELPIGSSASTKDNWSIVLQDEIFIGWGKNVGENVFDQNRMGVLLSYKVNENIKFESGYINQVLQQGKRINNYSVFQYNHGFLVAANISASLYKK